MVKPACGSLDFWTLQQLDKSQCVTGILDLGRPLRLWQGGWPFLPSSRCRVPSPDLLPSRHPGSASRASLGADTCSLRLPGPAALVPQCRTPSRAAHRRGLPAQAGLVQTAPRCPLIDSFPAPHPREHTQAELSQKNINKPTTDNIMQTRKARCSKAQKQTWPCWLGSLGSSVNAAARFRPVVVPAGARLTVPPCLIVCVGVLRLPCCPSLRFADTAFFFFFKQIKALWQFCVGEVTRHFLQLHLLASSLCHILVIRAISQAFSLLYLSC